MATVSTTIKFQGWESITDVPCPITGCAGELRWAEAGYVPGYRICDGCGSHFALRYGKDGENQELHCVKRLRPSVAKTRKMEESRNAAEVAQERFAAEWRSKQTAQANAQWPTTREVPWGSHGVGSVEIPPQEPQSPSAVDIESIEPAEYRDLIRRCWGLTSALRKVARGGFSDGACILSATRDGQAVMVYHVGTSYLSWDGWWHTADLERCIVNGRQLGEPGKLSVDECRALGVNR